MSQAELAAALGVHPMTVSKWERGVIRIPEMAVLALEALEGRKRRRPTRPDDA